MSRIGTAAPINRIAGALGVALLFGVGAAAPAQAGPADVAYVVDGDTIRLESGDYVRFIGIDTPEVGQCGYQEAKDQLDRWIGSSVRLVNPSSVEDRDNYDRLLRYVQVGDRDTGLALIRKGLAKARYDGRDGHSRHPRQARYRKADRRSDDFC